MTNTDYYKDSYDSVCDNNSQKSTQKATDKSLTFIHWTNVGGCNGERKCA